MTPENASQTAGQGLVDPRVARVRGYRVNRKAHYDYPGMTDEHAWRRSLVHKHTVVYGCAWCGTKFSGPAAVYTHLAKRHSR